MSIEEFYKLRGVEPKVNKELNGSPYKYFHKWKYDTEIDFANEGSYINERRADILKGKANDIANSSVEIVNWVFGIYIVLYLLNSARKWLYKK